MNDTGIAVAVYDTHIEAESAVKALQRAGFATEKISIVGRDRYSDEDVKFFGKPGALRDGPGGMLPEAALVLVPVVGSVVVPAPLAHAVKGDKFLLVVHGDAREATRAREALGV